jgi:hypothetical protein
MQNTTIPANATFVVVEVIDGKRGEARRMSADELREVARRHAYARYCPAFPAATEAARTARMSRRIPEIVESGMESAWDFGRTSMSGQRRGWKFDVKASWFADAQ